MNKDIEYFDTVCSLNKIVVRKTLYDEYCCICKKKRADYIVEFNSRCRILGFNEETMDIEIISEYEITEYFLLICKECLDKLVEALRDRKTIVLGD